MKEIQLTRGQVALIDDEDFDRANAFKWFALKGKNTFYAARSVPVNGKRNLQYMHKFIMGDNPLKLDIDHRDGDGLNDQKENLRLCTRSENQMNRGPNKNHSSVYKGVCWHKSTKKWIVHIQIDGKLIYLGLFNNDKYAAKAYDQAAKKYFGEFAYLNFHN